MAAMEENEPDAIGEARARPPGVLGDVPMPVIIAAAILAACYFGLEAAPSRLADEIGAELGFSPQRFAAAVAGGGGLPGAILTLFTHMAIHASIGHLFFNLLWLIVFGAPIARRLGGWRFALLFIFSAAAGALFFGIFHLRDATLLVGASGGVTGLLGGLVRYAFHRPRSRPASEKGVLPLFDRSVITWSAVIISMNAAVALFGPGFGAGDADIAWQAHVGGYLFGLVAFPLFDPKPR
jgi:membrane associated rhomboid family serine protease